MLLATGEGVERERGSAVNDGQKGRSSSTTRCEQRLPQRGRSSRTNRFEGDVPIGTELEHCKCEWRRAEGPEFEHREAAGIL